MYDFLFLILTLFIHRSQHDHPITHVNCDSDRIILMLIYYIIVLIVIKHIYLSKLVNESSAAYIDET